MYNHPYLKLGLRKRKPETKTCKLANYFSSTLPAAPASVDWQAKAEDEIQLFENDKIGDCAVAGFFHYLETQSANAGDLVQYTDQDAEALYSAAGGYNPAIPDTDNGLVLVDFLNYLMTTGYKGNRIVAHAEVNFRNPAELKVAEFLFGGLYWGFNLPLATQNMGSIWDTPSPGNPDSAVAGSWGGHCVNSTAYDATGQHVVTSWGSRITVTPAFIAAYADECHVIVTNQWFTTSGLSPSGFNLSQLIADLNSGVFC